MSGTDRSDVSAGYGAGASSNRAADRQQPLNFGSVGGRGRHWRGGNARRGRGPSVRGRGQAQSRFVRNQVDESSREQITVGRGSGANRGGRGGRGMGLGGGIRGRGRGRRYPQHTRKQGAPKYLSKEEIEGLATSNNSSRIIHCITENEGGFLAAYSHPPNSSDSKMLKHLIKLLYLLVKSEDNHLASRIVAEIFDDSSGTSIFLRNMEIAIRRMPAEIHHEHVKQENLQYLNYLVEIGMFAITTAPQSVMYTFPSLSMNDTIQKLSQLAEDVETLKAKVQGLTEEFSSAVEVFTPQQLAEEEAPEYQPPPQHFTGLRVLPTTKELQPHGDPPYLRPNITNGAYTDWEHYLDVQFRLMREDFVAPLRDGIAQCLEGVERRYLSEVRVYNGVRVCTPACLHSGIGFQIYFDVSRLQRVNWEHSKRLIFGSLLCLSCDNFQTMLFATVVDRNPELLEFGLVTVQFEGERLETCFQINPDQYYVMVESTAYFEAYRHILDGLKQISFRHFTERLSMFKRYLIDCQLNSPIPAPRYLLYSENATYDLKAVLKIQNSNPNVVLMDPSSWPPCENTCLDTSQLSAFRAALTQEVSVIQGPPGTGKTYIGLKIVEALAGNQNRFRSFPILVLCYTNHALDQFLEGIMDIRRQHPFFGQRKLDIVRIGGRCKSLILEDCCLKAKISKIRSQRSLPDYLYEQSSRLRNQIQLYRDDIELAQLSAEATIKGDKIFKFSFLERFIRADHAFQLTKERSTDRGREIDIWLNLWFVHGDQKPPSDTPADQDDESNQHHNDSSISTENQEKSADDEFIEVDAEAQKLEEERFLDGEDFDIFKVRKITRDALFASNIIDDRQLLQSESDSQWKVVQISSEKRQKRIKYGHSNQPMSQQEANAVKNIWKLNLKNRWRLYLYWVNQLIRTQKEILARTASLYDNTCKEYAHCRQEIDAYVIRMADVVGMTTTGAAKYNHILSRIGPKIVIIEEAAEVFEAHVLTSLTPSVQQLIMIGDHKQLRPKANCYNLEKNYELCVSLFERLAKNGFPVFTLEVQHRMRPEIASLICPSIYEKLINHDDVEHYEHVKGVGKDLFFIDHNHPEKIIADKDKSHSNDHEADFLVSLCKYLLKQGYHPSQITILTMYRGQLLEMRNKMRRRDYQGVRVAAVDDFQGEENDIILLSLVRSNSEGSIGFLKIENRICVSLSRAKMGLYVIGNLTMLRDRYDTVWPQIIENLSKKGCVGDTLPLFCRNHPKTIVNAKYSEDFKKCPEGGCQEKCSVRLDCGHSCPRFCHPVDTEHKLIKCKQTCPKVLVCDHVCGQKCWKCKPACLPCSKIVVKKIDRCGHEIEMPCHRDPSSYPCTVQCDNKLACGHSCQELCSMPHTLKCQVLVKKELPCGHSGDIPCALDVKEAKCNVPCDKLLDCGHKCPGNCFQCRRGRLHVRCQSSCGRTLVCGHECDFPCTPECPPCIKRCNNYCVHSRCNRKCFEHCVPCNEPCTWKCEHHKCTRLCGEICNRPPCNEPCKKMLKCGHPCIGLCGEKCPSKCRICNQDEVCEIFFGSEDEEDARFIELEECKHVIEVTACDEWIAQAADENSPTEIQFKTCPKCKTQIRKSVRYGNIVKQTLEDYEKIKEKQLASLNTNIMKKLEQIKDEVSSMATHVHPRLVFSSAREGTFRRAMERARASMALTQISKAGSLSHQLLFQAIVKSVQDIGDKIENRQATSSWAKSVAQLILPPHVINNINCQLTYLQYLIRMVKYLKPLQSNSATSDLLADAMLGVSVEDIQEDILILLKFLMQDFLSKQQTSDIQSEIYRLMSLIKLMDLWYKIRTHGKPQTLSEENKLELTAIVKRLHSSSWKLNEEDNSEILHFIIKIGEQYKVNGLTEAERIEIVSAIGLTKGHWFKCPNGHFYCIGECGGAMQEARCPECGAKIGGQSHRLTEDNQLAPEMDGARHAAWSEAANLANFDLDNLM